MPKARGWGILDFRFTICDLDKSIRSKANDLDFELVIQNPKSKI
jgi:hypothetical protein